MPTYCNCGQEINDATEMCPACGANIRAQRAEEKAAMLADAIQGWRRQAEKAEAKAKELEEALKEVIMATDPELHSLRVRHAARLLHAEEECAADDGEEHEQPIVQPVIYDGNRLKRDQETINALTYALFKMIYAGKAALDIVRDVRGCEPVCDVLKEAIEGATIMAGTQTKDTAGTAGVCCSCRYDGIEETECPARDDRTHCEHWFDG